jgi:hypothetical protein
MVITALLPAVLDDPNERAVTLRRSRSLTAH